MIEITVDAPKGRLLMTILGFIGADQIGNVDDILRNAVLELRRDWTGEFDLLVVARDSGPASQQMATAITGTIAKLRAQGLRRSANVTASSLVRMQLQRLSDKDDRFRFFADIVDAESWLDQA